MEVLRVFIAMHYEFLLQCIEHMLIAYVMALMDDPVKIKLNLFTSFVFNELRVTKEIRKVFDSSTLFMNDC
jgi:hypothetical protein